MNLRKRMSWPCLAILIMTKSALGQSVTTPHDLSFFHTPSASWKIVSNVRADLEKGVFDTSEGSGIIVNTPGKKNRGKDLVSKLQHGDLDLELDYMMAKGSNSGIYFQGRYEIQLLDSWGVKNPRAGDNGGIYERWNDNKPNGAKGYEGYAPRQNASRAPGLWQHLKVSFQSPRFDASGKKTANAKMLSVELNGVVIHENVELFGSTRGAIGDEAPLGPLRIQGDHGSVAFRNIILKTYEGSRPEVTEIKNVNGGDERDPVDPILVNASENRLLRSFMDLPGGQRVVHAVSLGSPDKIHYTYDMDNGSIVQVWRGEFLDATPMWHSRGDGSSRAAGAVQYFGKPLPTIAKLSTPQSQWMTDTTGSGFRQKGYTLSPNEEPTFHYRTFGASVSDAIKVLEHGQGISRTVIIEKPSANFYLRLAQGKSIEQLSTDLFLIDDKSYYLRLDDVGKTKPIIKDVNGQKELIIPIQEKITYSILF